MVESFLSILINNFSYLGVFIASIITSASILIPLPGQLTVILAVLLELNPIITSLLMGIGSMIGELPGYGLGVAGGKLMKKKFRRQKKLVEIIKKYYTKYAFWVIMVTAFIFFPFDLVGILSGATRYDLKKFLIAGFIGKFFKTLVLYFLIQSGIQIFGFTGL